MRSATPSAIKVSLFLHGRAPEGSDESRILEHYDEGGAPSDKVVGDLLILRA